MNSTNMNRELVGKNRDLIRSYKHLLSHDATVHRIRGCRGALVSAAVRSFNLESRLGDFVAFTVYLGMLTWPMIAFGWVVNLLERGRASMERLNYILPMRNPRSAMLRASKAASASPAKSSSGISRFLITAYRR